MLGIAALAALASCFLTGCASQSDYGYGPAAAGFYDDCDDGYCVGYPYGRVIYLQTPATRSQRLPVSVAKHPPAPRPVPRGTTSASIPRGTASVSMPRMAGSNVSTHVASSSTARR